MKKLILLIFMFTVSHVSHADWSWTDNNNFQGIGIGVEGVYPQFDKKWITFKGSDGKNYHYKSTAITDTNAVFPTQKDTLIVSMLLTALASGKKISIYRNTVPNGIWYEFNHLNLHN